MLELYCVALLESDEAPAALWQLLLLFLHAAFVSLLMLILDAFVDIFVFCTAVALSHAIITSLSSPVTQ